MSHSNRTLEHVRNVLFDVVSSRQMSRMEKSFGTGTRKYNIDRKCSRFGDVMEKLSLLKHVQRNSGSWGRFYYGHRAPIRWLLQQSQATVREIKLSISLSATKRMITENLNDSHNLRDSLSQLVWPSRTVYQSLEAGLFLSMICASTKAQQVLSMPSVHFLHALIKRSLQGGIKDCLKIEEASTCRCSSSFSSLFCSRCADRLITGTNELSLSFVRCIFNSQTITNGVSVFFPE